MTYAPNQNYVRNAAGVWTPVGYGATDSTIPVSNTTAGLKALGITAGITGYGAARTSIEPTNIFSDAFDTGTGIDTINRWNTGGTVVPTVATGAALVRPGATTASASSSLQSKPSFTWPGLNFVGVGWIARFENINSTPGTAGYTNAHRFYGIGTVPTTWVAAYTGSATTGPMQYAVGFETDIDGFMYPVVYDNGVRTRPTLVNGNANLNVGRTLFNGQAHQFLVVVRAEAIFWYVDGTDTPVAIYNYNTTGFTQPDVAGLPIRFHQINATSATSGVTENRIGAVGVGDTGRNGAAIADATYPWRESRVTPAGELVTTTSNRAVTYKGRSGSFRQLGIAGTAGQRLFTMFNAAGSGIIVDLESITYDVYQTAARVVAPPVIRLHRTTTLPTGGTAMPKVAVDTALTSSASVTLLQGTASDGGAATAITATPGAGTLITQEPVARALTLVGYEQFDRGDFLDSTTPVVLRPGEGVILNLDYNTATSNPVTDNYIVNCRWSEYTIPA